MAIAVLDPQPWMTAPTTRQVVAALTAVGTEVRFVGGCVRDAVAGRPVKDIDIATPDTPDRVIALLERAGLRAIPTGLSHGTVTAVAGGQPFEITTLRRDVETFGRRARVAFTDDWIADAARRDFTINALSCAPDGTLYDPFGGLDDLREGLVRFVGDPVERLREDVLRLLRFFRFQAYFGRRPPDPASLEACRAMAPRLPGLSGERVRAELLRLLEAPDPVPVMTLMADAGVLAPILPEARRFDRLAALIGLERAHARPDPLRRLAAVLAVDAAGARAVAERLRLSNAERDRLVVLSDCPDLGWDGPGMRRALHRLGGDRYRDLALLAAGDAAGGEDGRLLPARLAEAAAWTPRRLPVSGADIMALGVPRGPAVGQAMAAVEEAWIASDFRMDRAACLDHARLVLGKEGR